MQRTENENIANVLIQPAYLCIAGPTASGKTAIALEIGRRWPVEIISVDSALVYLGLDIGSAKPSSAEMAEIPHHLIDIREANDPYSAADFVTDAKQLITEITQRKRTPLLVGGTMLYFKALIEGLDDLPTSTPAIRAEIESRAAQIGWLAMHQELQQIDPQTALRLKPNDSQRIQRALEVYALTGKPISSFYSNKESNAFPPMLSLEPLNRAWLHERIATRFNAMLEHGFLDEVKGLMQRSELNADLPSMRAVGYRQAWGVLERAAVEPMNDAAIKKEIVELGIPATRQLAKRQITWLRSMPERHIVHGDDADVLNKSLLWAKAYLEKPDQT